MAKILAFANQKGGVAKTTTTFNIGVGLSKEGFKVLMIDLDSQASLTISAKLEPYNFEKSIVSVLDETKVDFKTIQNLRENLDIITSRIELADLEMKLIGRTVRETILKRALSEIEQNYDYILIDCPPQLSILTINALTASDYVVITTKTDYLSYRGLEQLNNTIYSIKELINHKLELLGVVATLHEPRQKDDKEILKALEENFKVLGVVPKMVAVKNAIYEGKAVVEIEKDNAVAIAYSHIVDKILEREIRNVV